MVDTINFGMLKWHHITNPTVEDLDFLRDNFHFHPLDIDDCSSFVQRPKIDIYDDGSEAEIRINGNDFLHNMVRFIIGMFIDIGTGKRPVTDMEAVLNGKDGVEISAPADVCGLFLESVRY